MTVALLKIKKLLSALTSIKNFITQKKPETIEEANAMLSLVKGICEENLEETEAEA